MTSLTSIRSLWNFGDPAESERRFLAALEGSTGDRALELRTQVARTYSLRREFAKAHQLLDDLELALAAAGVKPRLRALLERGRTFNSAGEKQTARGLFLRAFELGVSAGEDDLAADAAHMIAIVEGGEEALAWNKKALHIAKNSPDEDARKWIASLLNNIGYETKVLGRLEEALEMFREAVAEREKMGNAAHLRSARWMVGNTLRLLGRAPEALEIQEGLERECEAANAPDGFVFEELAELAEAAGDHPRAAPYFARAAALLEGIPWIASEQPARIQRLRDLSRA